MATWAVVLLFSVGAVLFLVVGLSLTLMIKGHHIDGEISTNRHMRERGITCAVHDAVGGGGSGSSGSSGRSAGRGGSGSRSAGCADSVCADGNCAGCGSGN